MSEATGTARIKRGMAEMLKGGVIMDVVNVEQAKIAEDAGACAVMALERVPADIRAQGGVARMSDPDMIQKIQAAVSIPVMAKVRIGHFVEAQIIESLGVDYIDESEVLTPADEEHHILKHNFKVPFVCGCRNIGEALRRIGEGAAMIRTKGEAGTGNVVEAVRHMRTIWGEMRALTVLGEDELMVAAIERQDHEILPQNRRTARASEVVADEVAPFPKDLARCGIERGNSRRAKAHIDTPFFNRGRGRGIGVKRMCVLRRGYVKKLYVFDDLSRVAVEAQRIKLPAVFAG